MNRLALMRGETRESDTSSGSAGREYGPACGEGDGIASGLDLFGEAALELASVLYTDLEQGGNTNAVVPAIRYLPGNPGLVHE